MRDVDDDEGGGLPFVVWAVIGVLAVIGFFSIANWLFAAVFWVLKLLVVGLVVLLVLSVLRAVVGGGRRHRSEL